MEQQASRSFTELLRGARLGDRSATDELFSLVYEQLKRLAHTQRLYHRGGTSLNTTALVHETFIKLADRPSLEISDRGHFMAVAAMAMRQILLDQARHRLAAKRGAGRRALSFEEIDAEIGDPSGAFSEEKAEVLLTLDDAVTRLAKRSERASKVVECRFFAGLSVKETARALGVSPATVKRDWARAQAWLYQDLRGALE